MSETIVVALVSLVGTLLVAGFTWIASQLVRLGRRVEHVERQNEHLTRQNRLGWLYTRALLDYGYRYADTVNHPLPQPPDGWLDPDTG